MCRQYELRKAFIQNFPCDVTSFISHITYVWPLKKFFCEKFNIGTECFSEHFYSMLYTVLN